MMKKILIGFAALALLVAGLVLFVGSNLDSLVKTTIEKYGTAATKAETTLQSVTLSPSEGTATLRGLKLANPQGFSSPSAIEVGEIFVKIDPKSLIGTGPIVIHEIAMAAPRVTYEATADGKSNMQAIQRNVQSFSGKVAETEKGKTTPSNAPKEERKLIIEKFSLKDGQIKLSHELLKGKDLAAVKLPDMNITNIGKNNGGAEPGAVAKLLLGQLSTNVIDAGGTALVKALRDQGIDSIKGAIEQSEVGKDVGNAIKGIFGQ